MLIRRPTLESTLPGSCILLTERSLLGWSEGQAEIVAVGPPSLPEEDEEVFPPDPRLVPGAWVLTRHRMWVATDRDDRYLIRSDDILGVFTGS